MKTERLAPDVVRLLERQHGAIKRGFLLALVPGPGRQHRFDRLRTLLAVHEAAEEAHVHPLARKLTGEARRMVRSRLTEERSAKSLLRDLDRSSVHRPGFAAKLLRLAVTVTRHARREEREEFAVLARGVSVGRRRLLGSESLLTQLIAPTRPHPRLNGQLAVKLTAPIVAPVDRARDLGARVRASR